MATKGGARPGAGRKPKAIKFISQIQQAEEKIADRLPWVVDKLLELAEGVAVEKITPTGVPIVYQQPPDLGALKYLADRIMGKPTERRVHEFPKPLDEMSDDELRAIIES